MIRDAEGPSCKVTLSQLDEIKSKFYIKSAFIWAPLAEAFKEPLALASKVNHKGVSGNLTVWTSKTCLGKFTTLHFFQEFMTKAPLDRKFSISWSTHLLFGTVKKTACSLSEMKNKLISSKNLAKKNSF